MRSQSKGTKLVGNSRLSCCLFAVTFVLLSVSSLYGDAIAVAPGDYTGTRTSGAGGGIYATGPWADGGFELSWNIGDNQDGTFSYQYSITGLGGAQDVKYWILQLAPNIDWTGVFDDVGFRTQVGQFTQGQSNKGMPGDLFGLKFKDGTLEVSFVTEYAPEWGSFYAYGGTIGKKNNKQDVYAYNIAFGTDPSGTNFTNWIPVDGVSLVPEPSTLILLLSGTGLLAGVARFRKTT